MANTARELNVSRVRVHQMLILLKLDERIVKELLNSTNIKQVNFWTERRLRELMKVNKECQFLEHPLLNAFHRFVDPFKRTV